MPSNSIVKDMAQKVYDDEREYTETELQKDSTWIEASKLAFKAMNGSDFTGTDEEAASEGLGMMGEFNYNLALGTIPMAAKLSEVDDESKLAFYYMMDAYDKKDISWNGVGRFLKGIGTDPTTYVGIGTLGIGLGAKEAAKFTARHGLKEMLKSGAKKFIQSTTAVAATEGALYTGAEDVARQEVAIQAGVQEEYDPIRTAVAAAGGAASGAVLVQGAKYAGKKLAGWASEGQQEMMKQAGGGTPPEYKMEHSAPMRSEDNGAGHDLTDLFGDDIYSPQAARYFGHGGKSEAMDEASIRTIKGMKDNPEKTITIYRAVPKGKKDINIGDWISINKQYAKQHGEAYLEKGYDVVSMKVKAKDIHTDANSIHEWGYDPEGNN